jgi:hypothetical protein
MGRTFKTAGLLLPLHLAPHPVALALACGAPPPPLAPHAGGAPASWPPCGTAVPIHWLMPGDDPALVALALVDNLTAASGGSAPGALSTAAQQPAPGGGTGPEACALAGQRLQEVAGWEVVARSVAALPGLCAGGHAAKAVLAAAGSLAALARASGEQLLAACGGDAPAARSLQAFFHGTACAQGWHCGTARGGSEAE